MLEFECFKQQIMISIIKNSQIKRYFKVLFTKYKFTNCLFYPNLIRIIANYRFDNQFNLVNNSHKNKEVFIQGMKTSTTVSIGDP